MHSYLVLYLVYIHYDRAVEITQKPVCVFMCAYFDKYAM